MLLALLVKIAYYLICNGSFLFNSQKVDEKLQILKKKLGGDDFGALGEIRQTVLELAAPPQLVCILHIKLKMFLFLSFQSVFDSII